MKINILTIFFIYSVQRTFNRDSVISPIQFIMSLKSLLLGKIIGSFDVDPDSFIELKKKRSLHQNLRKYKINNFKKWQHFKYKEKKSSFGQSSFIFI